MKARKTSTKGCREDDSESLVVRAECTRRNLDAGDLAKHAGVTLSYLRHLLVSGFRSKFVRIRVEFAMGTPIFSSPEEFAERQAVVRLLGGRNPYFMSLAELRQVADQEGVPRRSRGRNNRAVLINMIAEHLRSKAVAGGENPESAKLAPAAAPIPTCTVAQTV